MWTSFLRVCTGVSPCLAFSFSSFYGCQTDSRESLFPVQLQNQLRFKLDKKRILNIDTAPRHEKSKSKSKNSILKRRSSPRLLSFFYSVLRKDLMNAVKMKVRTGHYVIISWSRVSLYSSIQTRVCPMYFGSHAPTLKFSRFIHSFI